MRLIYPCRKSINPWINHTPPQVSTVKFYFLLALLITSIVFSGCQDNEDIQPTKQKTERLIVKEEHILEVKEKLFQKLRGANKEGLFQVANEGAEKFKIKWDHIRLLRDSTGMETYAFGVEDINNDPKTFYNLIFKLTPEGTPYQPYLMKYSMTEAFADHFSSTG